MQGQSTALSTRQTKPKNGSFWGYKSLHYALVLFILTSTLQQFTPDVKQWSYSEVNGIAATYARGEFGSQRTFLCNDLDNDPSKLMLQP